MYISYAIRTRRTSEYKVYDSQVLNFTFSYYCMKSSSVSCWCSSAINLSGLPPPPSHTVCTSEEFSCWSVRCSVNRGWFALLLTRGNATVKTTKYRAISSSRYQILVFKKRRFLDPLLGGPKMAIFLLLRIQQIFEIYLILDGFSLENVQFPSWAVERILLVNLSHKL